MPTFIALSNLKTREIWLNTQSVQELKANLAQLGRPVSGSKIELIKRLDLALHAEAEISARQ